MIILDEFGNDDIAKVYVAELRESELGNKSRFTIEFVESIQPPLSREKKYVLIVSSLFGCPVNCKMCDAGGCYSGKLSTDEILNQIKYMVYKRWPDGIIKTRKLKIQFARMGEPSLNNNVLDAMERLPKLFNPSILNMSLSTVAPSNNSTDQFFERLLIIKNEHYSSGNFQLQFSIHTTDEALRDDLIPVSKWSFNRIAEYGTRFYRPENSDRKITLNFALTKNYPINPIKLREYFNPETFLIKLTPLNPTFGAQRHQLKSAIDPNDLSRSESIVESIKQQGYDIIMSIGELEENKIGSNCGQYIQRALTAPNQLQESYDLEKYKIAQAIKI